MPGKRWTRAEKQLLKEQIAGGIPAHNIAIENRTWNGIAYILRALRIFWSNRWTKAQIRSLVRQIIKERKRLPDIYIEGKSPAAVNNQRRRLRLRGKLDIGQSLRKRKYSDEELAILEHYGCKLGWSARQIYEAGMLPNRSYHSISKAMGRQGYRTEKIKRLLSLQQRLKRRGCQARTRVCKSCACEWFALPVFFPTHTDKRKRGARISMSRTCRICKMKLKLEKGDESTVFGESLVRLSKMTVHSLTVQSPGLVRSLVRVLDCAYPEVARGETSDHSGHRTG